MRGTDGSGSSGTGSSAPRQPPRKNIPVPKVTLRFSHKGHQQLFLRAVHKPAGGDSAPTAASRSQSEPRSSLGPAPRGVRERPSGPASPEGRGAPAGSEGPAARAVLRGVPPQTLTEPGRPKSAPRTPDDEPHHGSGGGRTPTGAPQAAHSPGGRCCPPIGPLPFPPHCSPLPLTALRSRGGLRRGPAGAGRGWRQEAEAMAQGRRGGGAGSGMAAVPAWQQRREAVVCGRAPRSGSGRGWPRARGVSGRGRTWAALKWRRRARRAEIGGVRVRVRVRSSPAPAL